MPTRNFFANSGLRGVTVSTLPAYPYQQYTTTSGSLRVGWWHRKRSWSNRSSPEDKSTHSYVDAYLNVQGVPFDFDEVVRGVPMYRKSGQNAPFFIEDQAAGVRPMAQYQLEIPMNKVLEKVAGATWDVPTFLAELGETSKMILGTARMLADAYRATKKGNLVLAAKHLGVKPPSAKHRKYLQRTSTKDAWMGMRYGWMPAVYDVCDAAEYAASKLLPDEIKPQFFSHFMVHSQVVSGTNVPGVDAGGNFGIGTATINGFHVKHTVTTKAWLRAVVANEKARSMAELGFSDPRVTAWELLPLSFVVDWFVQVGDYLRLSSALRGLKILDAGYSILHVADGSVWVERSDGGQDYSFGQGVYPSATVQSRVYERIPWDNPSPRLTTSPPSDLNWKRIADATCLLSNVFK